MLQAVNVWVDRWEINVGDSLIDKVEDAIAGASALLVVLSKTSAKSNWVKKEVNAGLVRELDEQQVVVLPVLIEDCEIPVFLREKLFADYRTSFDDGLRSTLEAVARVTNPNSARTVAPNFHTDWGLDWGLLDGRLFLRLKFVEQVIDQPYTVLSEVRIICNDAATASYAEEIEMAGQGGYHRRIISLVADHAQSLTFLLDDHFEKVREFEVSDGVKRYSVFITAQRLGEDTGRDVLYRVGQQIIASLRHMTDVGVGMSNDLKDL